MSGRALGGLAALGAAGLLVSCDPGAGSGFAPIEPLPTPDPVAEPAPWWPAEADAVGPDTQVLDVLLVEQTCAGGEPADDRVHEPVVEADAERVVVTVRVEPREGLVTCPGNPPTTAVVDLGEPLGERVLLDGSADPPREPTPLE